MNIQTYTMEYPNTVNWNQAEQLANHSTIHKDPRETIKTVFFIKIHLHILQ